MEVCSLNYKRFGDTGSIIVILHGLFGMLDNWNSFARNLSKDHIVYILDLRNHGKSCHQEEMSYAAMAGDLSFFLLEHGLSKINLIGHSMGGKVAMHLSLEHPELVEKLVVIDIAPKAYKPAHIPIFNALQGIDLSKQWTRAAIFDQLAQKIPNTAIVQFLMKNLKRQGTGFFVWKFNLPVIRQSYEKIIGQESLSGRFNKPVLFVKGMNSSYIQTTDKSKILKLFPEATVIEIEQSGHWIHAEQPLVLLKELHVFFDS